MRIGRKRLTGLTTLVALAALGLAFMGASVSAKPYGDEVVKYDFGGSKSKMVEIQEQIRDADASEKKEIEKRLIDTLKAPGATYASQQWVCRMLRIVGTDECVPALKDLLKDKDLSHMARYALQDIPHPEAGAALREALSELDGKLQVGVIDSLAARGDKKAVPQLADLAESSNKDVARSAIIALGRIGGEKATAALADVRVADSLQNELDQARLSCADHMLAAGQKRQASRVYREMFESDKRLVVRIAALRGIARSEGADAADDLLECLKSDEVALQQAAAKFIREVPGKDITREFAAQLSSLGSEAQVALLGALAERGDSAGAPGVAKLVKSGNEDVRAAALRTLGSIGDASHVSLLAEMATRGAEVGDMAYGSLTKLEGDDVDPAIVEGIQKRSLSSDARKVLIRSLADRGYDKAVPALLKAAKSGDAAVQTASLKALADLAGAEDARDVVELLTDVSGGAVPAAQSAVVAACKHIEGESERVGPVVSAFTRTDDAFARASLLGVLGELGGKRALQLVMRATRSDQEQVREAAVRTLADWPDTTALRPLMKLAHDADSRTHRILALRGVIRLLGQPSNRSASQTVGMYRRALEMAERSQEQSMALSGLASVPSIEALELIEPYLEKEGLQREARTAYLEVASTLAPTHPSEAKEALQRVIDEAESDRVRSRARKALDQVEKYSGYVLGWKIAGPYTQQGKGSTELFNVAFQPEKNPEKAEWRVVHQGVDRDNPYIFDLSEILGGDNRVAYLRTHVHSPEARKARLEIGSDDGVKAWLNGKVVHENNTGRGVTPGQDKAQVSLQKGWNTLMLKITQGGGGWGACARIRGPQGGEIEGLRISAQKPE